MPLGKAASISAVISAACAFSSCRQTTSALCFCNQAKKPLLAAERIPFKFAVIMRILSFNYFLK